LALDHGRKLLETLPYPENLDHHFVVDPAKFDFYAMDCYRVVGEDRLARMYAHEVIRAATDGGLQRKPMRVAEAHLTLGVVAVRSGHLEEGLTHGRRALAADRKSLPSLVMVSADLVGALNAGYADDPQARQYVDDLRTLAA